MIYQLYRTYYDEDGTHRWWTYWQPSDRLTGRTVLDGDGTELIEVEHIEPVLQGLFGYRTPTGTRSHLALYRPEGIRYLVRG